jgi:hypothetical protein
MGEIYFCNGRNVLLTDLTKTCLGALYLADAKNIQDRWKFSISGAQEKIFSLDSNTYVVYSLRKIHTNHVCAKAKSILAVHISSGQTIRINPSCYIRTMDHIITADDSEEIEIHSKWLDWTWTLGQLYAGMGIRSSVLCLSVSYQLRYPAYLMLSLPWLLVRLVACQAERLAVFSQLIQHCPCFG